MSPQALFGSLPGALQALHLHLPFARPRPSPAARLAARLQPLRRDPRAPGSLLPRALDLEQELAARQPRPALTGRWRKDAAASDSMADAMEMVDLQWVLRQAIKALNHLQINETETHFVTNLKAGGPLDVVERYPWDGAEVLHARRDKRRGTHRGRFVRSPAGPRIEVEWEDPYGGECADTFTLSPDGESLSQVTEMRIRGTGRQTTYTTIYRRAR